MTVPEGFVACGGPTLEQVYPEGLQSAEKTVAFVAREKCEVERVAERSCRVLTTTPSPSPCAAVGVD